MFRWLGSNVWADIECNVELVFLCRTECAETDTEADDSEDSVLEASLVILIGFVLSVLILSIIILQSKAEEQKNKKIVASMQTG